MTRPVAVLLPGAGSSADFVRRAFAAALADHEVVAVPPEPGPFVVDRAAAALDAAAAAYGDRLQLVGGVSLGAHVAARWATGRTPAPPAEPGPAPGPGRAGWGLAGWGPAGLVLALPAWTGRPGAVAAATGAAADQVDRLGIAGALAAARAAGVGWVADELAAAWPAYGDRLGPTLRAAAQSAGPSVAELRALDLPVGLVAFTNDPLHPLAVAEQWAALLPRATLHRLGLADLAIDRGRLGAAARTALDATRLRPVRPPAPPD